MRSVIISGVMAIAVAAGAAEAQKASPLPDPATTPGAVSPDITPETIQATICNSAWSTRLVRPPASYTGRLKRQQLAVAGYQDQAPAHYEEDHLMPLELGGSPTDPRNLWPEPRLGACGARWKDRLENRLHSLVCAGAVPLRQAQQDIATDWIAAYRRYVGDLSCRASGAITASR